MSTTTRISIEKIATGTIIEVPGFGPAEVYGSEFDGEGYSVSYCYDDRGGWDALDSLYVKAGQQVEAYDHQTFLRADKDISFEEWQAKNEAIGYDIDRKLVELNRLQGHVCRPLPETVLVDAVADALGVPAMAAE